MGSMRGFKERLKKNANTTIRGEKRDSVLNIQLTNNMTVRVDRNGNRYINNKDIEDNIKDVFIMCSSMRKNQLINLSSFCDCMYDLLFLGSRVKENNTELLFKVV